MNESETLEHRLSAVIEMLADFHRDDAGVAMTEYIIVFSLISFSATVGLIMCAIYVKAYRDFLVWWLGHPAV